MLLPLGSIVYLKEGTVKTMIINRAIIVEINGQERMFEYEGCLYPMGSEEKKDFFFNSEQIDRVVFKGYADEDEERFQQVFTEWQEKNQIPLAEVEHSEQDEEDRLFGEK